MSQDGDRYGIDGHSEPIVLSEAGEQPGKSNENDYSYACGKWDDRDCTCGTLVTGKRLRGEIER